MTSDDRSKFLANASAVSEEAGEFARATLDYIDRSPEIRLAIAYGSAARGDAHAASDLDIWLEIDGLDGSPASEERALQIRETIRQTGPIEPFVHPPGRLKESIVNIDSVNNFEFAQKVWSERLVLIDRDDQMVGVPLL